VLPLFLEGDGIWWAVAIAEYAVAVFAICYMIRYRRTHAA